MQAPLAEQALEPTPQFAHTAPAAAHCETVRGETQVPPMVAVQQPLAHEVASHRHWPARQRCPAPAQGGFTPQKHPPAVQVSAVMPQLVQAPPGATPQLELEMVWHRADPSQQPPGHVEASQ